ncbi:hypothetical protein VN91_2400 [Lactococcus lactis subsp. lactis]|nr:hypothetical protein VN91_2400 [Lactococcus lactis subsp. lactis]
MAVTAAQVKELREKNWCRNHGRYHQVREL